MKEVDLIKLEQRISQLERKLASFFTRTRKEIIWRKHLEDWILQQFNYDVRLQVELKSLENDGEELDDELKLDRLDSTLENIQITQQQLNPTNTGIGQNFIPSSSSSSVLPLSNHPSAGLNIGYEIRKVQSQVTPEKNKNSTISSLRLQNFRSVPLPPSITVTTVPTTSASPTRMPVRRLVPPPQSFNKTVPEPPKRLISESSDLRNPVIVSTSTVAAKKPRCQSPEVIILDDDDETSTSRNRPTSSSAVCSTRNLNVSASSSSFVESPMPLNFLGQFSNLSNDNNYGLRTENADSSINETYVDFVQLESAYRSENYLTRSDDLLKLQFNVRKILLEHDPYCTPDSLNAMIACNQISSTERRNITTAVSEFLMRVYGENPPRVAKDSMAESLFSTFPFVNRDIWYCKVPNKNPSGHIEHKINNLRRSLRDSRKKLQHEEGDSILPQ